MGNCRCPAAAQSTSAPSADTGQAGADGLDTRQRLRVVLGMELVLEIAKQIAYPPRRRRHEHGVAEVAAADWALRTAQLIGLPGGAALALHTIRRQSLSRRTEITARLRMRPWSSRNDSKSRSAMLECHRINWRRDRPAHRGRFSASAPAGLGGNSDPNHAAGIHHRTRGREVP